MIRITRRMTDTIRKRLLFLFLSTTLLSAFISLYVLFAYSNLTDNIGGMFQTSILLEGVRNDLNEANTNLYGFLNTRSNENLLGYSRARDRLETLVNDPDNGMRTDLYLDDILNMIPTYLSEADLAIDARRARDPAYMDHYRRANSTLVNIRSWSDAQNLRQLQNNTTLYVRQRQNIGWFRIASIVMILDMIALSIFLILYITLKMTDPILRLSHASEEISKGNFDVEEIPATGEEEIRVMAQAFNRMKNSIRTYIGELQSKSETESMLMEQKLENMRMQSLLDASRLQALRAQINPHFLFNTLNAGIQLSIMEGSDRTTVFLENLSDLFRYNIRSPDQLVPLQEEIQHVHAYAELMTVRFGDSILFLFDVEKQALDVPIPPLSIQTLVENACIHGLGNRENGKIRIKVADKVDTVHISISDNGAGMEPDIVADIFYRSDGIVNGEDTKRPGHTTGIGLPNVIQRLRLHTGDRDCLRILSETGVGTTVTVILPKRIQGGNPC